MKKLTVALLLGILACGSDASSDAAAPSKLAGSCNNANAGFCNEFTGSSYTPAGVEDSCKAQGAGIVFLPGLCPSDGRVGTCLVRKGTSTESYYRYYAAFPGTPSAAAAAEKQCVGTLKADWTPN
jgi:hypothetical protein